MALFNMLAVAVQETVNPVIPHIDRIPMVDQFISVFIPAAQFGYAVGVLVFFYLMSRRYYRIHEIVTAEVRKRAKDDGYAHWEELTPPLRYHLFSAWMCLILSLSWPVVVILKPEEVESV